MTGILKWGVTVVGISVFSLVSLALAQSNLAPQAPDTPPSSLPSPEPPSVTAPIVTVPPGRSIWPQMLLVRVNAQGNVLMRGNIKSVLENKLLVKNVVCEWTVNTEKARLMFGRSLATSPEGTGKFSIGNFVTVLGAIDPNRECTVNARIVNRLW